MPLAVLKVVKELQPFGERLFAAAIPTSYIAKSKLLNQMVETLLTRGALEEARRGAAEACLDEALNNAIRHGNKGDLRRQINVVLFADNRRWAAIISDEGEGFDPRAVPDPASDENLLRENGRGILLMRRYLQELIYNERGDQVMLIMARSAAAPESDLIP